MLSKPAPSPWPPRVSGGHLVGMAWGFPGGRGAHPPAIKASSLPLASQCLWRAPSWDGMGVPGRAGAHPPAILPMGTACSSGGETETMMWFMYARSSRCERLMGFPSRCSPSSESRGCLKSTECRGFRMSGCMIGLGISWMTRVPSCRGLAGLGWGSDDGGQWLFSMGDTDSG